MSFGWVLPPNAISEAFEASKIRQHARLGTFFRDIPSKPPEPPQSTQPSRRDVGRPGPRMTPVERIEGRLRGAEEARRGLPIEDSRHDHANGYIRGLREALSILKGEWL